MRFVKLISVATLFAASLAVTGAASAATPEEIARQRILDSNKQRTQQPAARPQPPQQPQARPPYQGQQIGRPIVQPQPQPQARPQGRPQPEVRAQPPQQHVRPHDGGGHREYRNGGGGRDYRDGGGTRDRGDQIRRGVAVGAGIAIIGGVLGYNAYRGPSRDRVYDRCDRNFPDFDYDTGTFVNDDGDREICPYLVD